MTFSWSAPDPRRPLGAAPAYATPYSTPATPGPRLVDDLRAGALTIVVSVLVGAPLGLLWAAVAPRVDVVVTGQDVALAEPDSSAFIAGDGFFLAAVALAGLVGGVVAWWLGREHGPAVVAGLTLGGLAAAYVAMVVGQQVGFADVERAVEAGRQGALELNLRLRAQEALVGWPVGSLLGYVGAAFVRGR